MIILSGVLVVLAIALLIAGVVFGNSGTEVVGLDGLTLIYVSIAVSIVSALCLAIGVFLRRRELFGASGSPAGKEPKGHKKARKGAGRSTAGLDPAGGDTSAEDTLKIPAQPVDVPGDALVHVVRGRKRYHLDNCRQLVGRQKEELTYAEAQEEGFSPCTACMPDTALAARAAVSADKAPGATGKKQEKAGATAGRGEATGSAKNRLDKAARTGAGTSPLDRTEGGRTVTAAGGEGRDPLTSRPSHAATGSGDDDVAERRPGTRYADSASAESVAERLGPDRDAAKAAIESASIWLPPAGGAGSRRAGRHAEEPAGKPAEDLAERPASRQEPAKPDSATTTEFEAVGPAAGASTHGKPETGDSKPADTRPADTRPADTEPADTASADAGGGHAATRKASASETSAPKTPAPETPAPETPAPETPAPETPAPRPSAPEASAPETSSSETRAAAAEQTADRPGAESTGDAPGESRASGRDAAGGGPQVRILSGTKRYHRPDCALIVDIGDDADDIEALSRTEATARGCTPCLVCEPDREHARD